ncbi:MAG: metalloregulator ArsR/SmtB family transcription factor [Spirochaetota bacterium]|nr:metalloregulator ArsR/SmtB family transcription factor [Spirochaetota bacterium]
MNSHKTGSFFKALCDETRLEIFMLLREGEKNVGELVDSFRISQPTISHHLSILRHANLVKVRKEGKMVYYSLNCDCVGDCCSDFFNELGYELIPKSDSCGDTT